MSRINVALLLCLALAGCGTKLASDGETSTRIIHNEGEWQEVFQQVHDLTIGPLSKMANGEALTGEDLHALEQSEPLTRGLVAFAPQNFSTRVILAQTLAALGRLDEAMEEYKFAVNLVPLGENEEIDFLVGECYGQMAGISHSRMEYEQALKYIDEALLRSPGSVKHLINKGSVLIELNREEDARSSLNQALELSPNNQDAKDLLKLIGDEPGQSDAS